MLKSKEDKMKIKIFKLLPALVLVAIAVVAMFSSQLFIASAETTKEVVEYQVEEQENQYQADISNSKILVFGQAEQTFEADQAVVNVEIESLDLDKQVSQEKNSETLKTLIKTLEEEGITKDKISINYYSSYFTTIGNSTSGTRTCTSLSYQVDNLENLHSSIKSVCNSGGTVNSVNYKLSDYQAKYNDLLTLAIENAKKKKKKLLGKDDVEVLKIKEQCSYQCGSKYQSYCEGMDEDLIDGEIVLSAKVELFAY